MIFFICAWITSFSFVFGADIYKDIYYKLIYTNSDIKVILDDLKHKLMWSGDNMENTMNFIEVIEKWKENERKENEIAFKFKMHREKEEIEELMEGKIQELMSVLNELSEFKKEDIGNSSVLYTQFTDVLHKHWLIKSYCCVSYIYYVGHCGLKRPGLKFDDEILIELRRIVLKQIQRVRYLQNFISELKNQNKLSGTNQHKIELNS